MINIDDILKREENRLQNNALNQIYLYKCDSKEGEEPWYRAYEWSAYLLEFFPNNLAEKLKPTHYKQKNNDIIQVGLQKNSFAKFLPNIDFSNIDLSKDSILISVNMQIYENVDFLQQESLLHQWKSQIPLKEFKQNQKSHFNGGANSLPMSMSKIISKVIAYQLYGKTEEELFKFIEELKFDCAQII